MRRVFSLYVKEDFRGGRELALVICLRESIHIEHGRTGIRGEATDVARELVYGFHRISRDA